MELQKENSLARVSFTGGLIGLTAGSQFGRLQKGILAENKKGWNLAEVIPENRNLIVWVFRIVLLILTLGLWTLATGYILVFERPVMPRSDGQRRADPIGTRREPQLTDVRKTR